MAPTEKKSTPEQLVRLAAAPCAAVDATVKVPKYPHPTLMASDALVAVMSTSTNVPCERKRKPPPVPSPITETDPATPTLESRKDPSLVTPVKSMTTLPALLPSTK